MTVNHFINTITLTTMLLAGSWSYGLCHAEAKIGDCDACAPAEVRATLDEQQRKIIQFFYEGAHPATGMAYNHSVHKKVLTTGATGFGVMAIIAGVERGWIERDAAAAHLVKIVRFLKSVPRYEGAWSHWYTPEGTPAPFGNQVAAGEIVETAFTLAGLLVACEYFDRDTEPEREIRQTTRLFQETINWKHYVRDGKLYWIWHSDTDKYELPLVGWNEALLVYVLAMAAPEAHRVPQSVYRSCWLGYRYAHPDRKTYGYPLPLGTNTHGGPLFLSQYSFLCLDPRLMQDEFAWYWTQCLGQTMINRHYCVYEAPEEFKYSEYDWGLTACGGCGKQPGYKVRAPFRDDGVLAPTAAISAYPFTPVYATQVLLNLTKNYPELDGQYGLGISYTPRDRQTNAVYLAIEHAPMAVMIENYRTGLFWKLTMRSQYIREGLRQAGMKAEPEYSPGFYLAMPDNVTQYYDMMRHPDRERYEIGFYSRAAGCGELRLHNAKNETIYSVPIDLKVGANVISFDDETIVRGENYLLKVSDATAKIYSINVNLR